MHPVDRAERLFGPNPFRFVPGLWRPACLVREFRRWRILLRDGLDAAQLEAAIVQVCDEFASGSLPFETEPPASAWIYETDDSSDDLPPVRATPVPPGR